MYKTVIFDLDGTLLDTLNDLHSAVNAALLKYGYPQRTKEEVRSFVGNGVKNLIKRSVNGVNNPDIEGVLQAFIVYYGAHCKDETQPYEGIMQLLLDLKEKGISTAVVSNKADFAVKILAEEYFQGLLLCAVGENEEGGVRKKPAPDSVLTVMQELNASPESTVYIGDSEVDIQTAKNAGVACISVPWGFKDEAFLLANGAERIARTPAEILKICLE